MMDWPLKARTSAPSSKFGASWKIHCTDLHSKKSLWLELQKVLDSFSVEVICEYTDSMPERCVALIAAKGGNIRY